MRDMGPFVNRNKKVSLANMGIKMENWGEGHGMHNSGVKEIQVGLSFCLLPTADHISFGPITECLLSI